MWQRAWTEPVRRAVLDQSPAFTRLVVLKAEVTWRKPQPQLAQAPVDYTLLARSGRPVGVALRVGPYTGTFDSTRPAGIYLANLAEKIVAEAARAGTTLSEFQIDFDCASSKLEDYRQWVNLIRGKIAPVPLVITALPAWLNEPAFRPLAKAADGFVLQVHSFERPRDLDTPFTLCDPAAARQAVAQAARLGVPFRAALPTYGYVVAFDSKGKFIGLSAEGPARNWPAGARLKQIRADPLALARLALDWSADPPPNLTGIIWYRLPVPGDILNWRWPTLNAIVHRRVPRKSVRANLHRIEPGLVEIRLANDGELDISSPVALQTRWHDSRLIAGDGLRGFQMTASDRNSARFEAAADYRLAAGESQVVGWLRFDKDCEANLELEE